MELELEQLLQLVLAAERQLERQLLLLIHMHQYHNQLSSSLRQCNHHSNRQQFRNHNFAVPAQLHGERYDRSQPEHKSEQIQHMGCSSTCCVESDPRFRQQLPGELVRLCHSDRKRKRS